MHVVIVVILVRVGRRVILGMVATVGICRDVVVIVLFAGFAICSNSINC